MTLSLRAKLLAIVGTAVTGFLALFVANLVLESQVRHELRRIEGEFLPKAELRPTLAGLHDEIARAFQDAVAARDVDLLTPARIAKETFQKDVLASQEAVGTEKAAALNAALEEYFVSADALSRRLIAGETGEDIVASMTSMQDRQKEMEKLLDDATDFDRRDLVAAFTSASSAQRIGLRIRISVITVSLATVLLLSLWLGRGVLRSLKDLTEGLERFGSGKLDVLIPITSNDELGAVAARANRMAGALRRSVAELEAFNYSVSHDLRAPLRPLDGFSQALLEDYGDVLDVKAKDYLKRIRAAAQRMAQLIEDMLQLSRLGRTELVDRPFDLAPIGAEIIADLRRNDAARDVDFVCMSEAKTHGDSRLIRIVLENLLRNAWKFSRKSARARIELGAKQEEGRTIFFVSDNGAGFDHTYAAKLFHPFQRLHTTAEFEGTGIGLAIVQRIIHRHDGRVWAEGKPGLGATFYFTLHDGRAS